MQNKNLIKFKTELNEPDTSLIYIRGGVESNEFRIDFYRIFRIIFHLSNQSNHKFSNRMNFEQIQHLKNLTPSYSWSRIESNEFRINFHQLFRIFFALSNQPIRKFSNRIERISNEFQFDSTPNLHMVNLFQLTATVSIIRQRILS